MGEKVLFLRISNNLIILSKGEISTQIEAKVYDKAILRHIGVANPTETVNSTKEKMKYLT